MAADTVVKKVVESEREKCGLDMSSYEDLQSHTVGGGGGGDCNGDGKDDYVFVNGIDSGSDDHGEGEPDGAVSGSRERVEEDDRLETGNVDSVCDERELNVCESNVGSREEVEGGGGEVSGGDEKEACKRDGDEGSNEIGVGGEDLEIGNEVSVDRESADIVEEDREVNSESEIKEESEVVVENGGSDDIPDGGDVEARGSELVAGNGDVTVPNGVLHTDSCAEKEDKCNLSVDETRPLGLDDDDDDDDDKGSTLLAVDRGSDDGSLVKDEVKNETEILEATPLVLDEDTEEPTPVVEAREHKDQGEKREAPELEAEKQRVVEDNVEPQGHEDQGSKPETPELETAKLSIVEDDVQPHVDEIPVREREQLDSDLKESQPLEEADAGNQLLEGGSLEMQPSNAESEGPHPAETSEPSSLNDKVKESLPDDSISDNQSLDCQQPESQPSYKESEELLPTEAKSKVDEQGDLAPPEVASTQDLSSVDPEAVACEVNESDEGEIQCQDVGNLTVESEVQESDTVFVQSEVAENQIGSESTAPVAVVERLVSDGSSHPDTSQIELIKEAEESRGTSTAVVHSDERDEPSVDSETKTVDEKGTSELIAQAVGSQESSIEKDVPGDQVEEETVSVKEISSEDHGSEKMSVAEETSLSEASPADGADVDNVEFNQGVVGVSDNKDADNLVDESQTDPAPDKTSDDGAGCLLNKDEDLNIADDSAPGLPIPSDSATIKQQGDADIASCVSDNSQSCSADETSLEANVESGNGSLPHSLPDPGLQNGAADGEVDVLNKSNYISNDSFISKISFGSFECEAPFSHNNVNVQPESNRSIEFVCSEPKVNPDDAVAVTKPHANGVHFSGANIDKTRAEHSREEGGDREEESTSSVQESGSDVISGQNSNPEVVRRSIFYLIKIPRYDDEKFREQIRLSEVEVEKKTQIRDSVRVELQKAKATLSELKSNLRAAKSEERAAHELITAKKREMDSDHSLINLAKNAMTVEDVQTRIQSMMHKQQHETLTINEEKQLVREIKQMNILKDQLSANNRNQEKLQQALDQRPKVEEHLKVLKKEMDALRDNLSKAEQNFKVAQKKCDDESVLLNALFEQFRSADAVRQKAYEDLLNLRKQWSEKNKYFRNYKDDARAANDLATAGNMDSLERHCANQVEKVMELWNQNDEFRMEYVRCNKWRTLRRFRTLDGRALGPDEEPPPLDIVSNNRVATLANINPVKAVSSAERDIPPVAKRSEGSSSKKVIEQKSKAVPAKTLAQATSKNSLAEASSRTEIEEEKEEPKLTREEDELARKAEQLRREEEAARLREQRKLEEKAKAREALERKRRLAEKAQARAEFRARKDAEQKEKEREKRAKKKEKKKGLTSETAQSEPALVPETSSETIREPEITEKPVTGKKPQKPSPYLKQIKTTKPIPPSLRKGKKRMPIWAWIGIAVLAVALFLLGNGNFLQNVPLFRRWASLT